MTYRLEHIERLFQAALELDPAARAAFLDRECAGDEALRREVESLLASHEQAQPFFGSPAVDDAMKLIARDQPEELTGRRIGAYELIREIGRGGMGAVYLAMRADEQYVKRVALKLVKPGMDSEAILRRVRQERQILASLNHPGIAKLLDGGTTEAGLPYLVMEYIEGQPIDQYCDRHQLSTQERLELFRQVCSAVQYAHRNLVVHRDLKPGNILVTAAGEPKLLDFGIAKLLNPELLSQTLAPTATVLGLMTPDYASPEQVRGEPITTASDVYSLGVVLYELLTGHRPYRVKTGQPLEMMRAICEEEPERPSLALSREVSRVPGPASLATDTKPEHQTPDNGHRTTDQTVEAISRRRGTTPERLRRRLKGDLDTIVMKALRKEPERRYASVEQMAEDIGRHLEGLPVRARKGTFSYRAGKFIRRHKAGMAAAVMVAVSLILGVVVATWQAQIAAQQRDKARREAAKAERINTFLQQMLSSADPRKKGRDVRVAEVLDEAARRVERDLADQPEVLAAVRRTIGITYTMLALYDSAEPHLRAAVELHRQLFGERHPETAKSLYALAALRHAQGDFAAAEPLYRQALAVQRQVLPEGDPDLVETLSYFGALLTYKGEFAVAETLLREALEGSRKVYGHDDERVAKVLYILGETLRNQGDLDGAEAVEREAIQIFRQLPGRKPAEMCESLSILGMVLHAKGEMAEAESVYRQCVDLTRRLLGESHPIFGFALMQLGNLYFDQGDYVRAEQEIRKALDIQRRTLPEEHVDIAASKVLLGLILTRAGRPVDGEPYLRDALKIRRTELLEGHWALANTESALGECLMVQGRYAEAEALLLKSYPRLKSKLGERHRNTLDALQRLVTLYDAWGRPERAAQYRARLPK